MLIALLQNCKTTINLQMYPKRQNNIKKKLIRFWLSKITYFIYQNSLFIFIIYLLCIQTKVKY